MALDPGRPIPDPFCEGAKLRGSRKTIGAPSIHREKPPSLKTAISTKSETQSPRLDNRHPPPSTCQEGGFTAGTPRAAGSGSLLGRAPEPRRGKPGPQAQGLAARPFLLQTSGARSALRSGYCRGWGGPSLTTLLTFSGFRPQPLLPHLPVDSHVGSSCSPRGN